MDSARRRLFKETTPSRRGIRSWDEPEICRERQYSV
jgi:hypothetical protein